MSKHHWLLVLVSSLLLVTLGAGGLLRSQEAAKPVKPGAELTVEESRQMDRLRDLYSEVGQQLVEAQARVKVLTEMQQKLIADFQTFQNSVVTARGHKAGDAVLDPQARKVVAAPKPEPAGK